MRNFETYLSRDQWQKRKPFMYAVTADRNHPMVGKCPSCGEWNTYVEEIVRKEVPNKRPVSGIESPKAKPVTLSEIEADEEPRIDMHDEELNRVLGGGLVPGSLVLIGGEPGIGKSTLVLQTVLHMPERRDTLHLGRKRAQGN